MTQEKRQRLIAGFAVIGMGLALWVLQRYEAIGPSAFFFLIGGAFMAAYLARKEYGFLIPACILLGLGAGSIGAGSFFGFGDATWLGLGFGFVAIFLIALLYERKSHWWPLIPGAALILLGLDRTREVFAFLYENWPLALVLVGVLILLGAFGKPKPRGDVP
jgi:hypothetical protein